MMRSFQRPASLALCILSIVWVICAAWVSVRFMTHGNSPGAVVMVLFGLAAVGLWFQSRVAAWALILCAFVGIIYALFSIGHAPMLRIAGRLCFAIWSLTLLFEFLKDDSSSREG